VLTGCEGGETDPAVDIPRYIKLLQSGKLGLDRLITHRIPFNDINVALDKVRPAESGAASYRCSIPRREHGWDV
jgi:Zn-dependent alcohol dehydrogenase